MVQRAVQKIKKTYMEMPNQVTSLKHTNFVTSTFAV